MVNYQSDVTVTLVDNKAKNYLLWIDADERMWETQDGKNKEVIGFEYMKICKIFGYK